MYGLQHGALAHTEQKAIKGPKITSVKPIKRENLRSNLYKKRETRNTYKLHKQTTTTVQSDSLLRTGANICSGIKRFNGTKPSPFFLKQ